MNLNDYQAAYGDLLLGVGTPYSVDWEQSTLGDLPSLRTSDAEIANGDGVWRGDDYADGQTIPFSVEMLDVLGPGVSVAVRTLADYAVPRRPRDLWFKLPHYPQSRCLRGVVVRRRAFPLDRHYSNGYARAELDLFAADPTRYGETQTVSTTGGGTVTGVNPGSKSSWPRIVVYGPMTSGSEVTVTDQQLGSTVAVSVVLYDGEQLVIDQQTGTALVDGWDDVGAWVTSRGWWSAQPGSTFTATVTAPVGVRVDLEWEPAWW